MEFHSFCNYLKTVELSNVILVCVCKSIRDIRSSNFGQIVDVSALHFQGHTFLDLLLKTIGAIFQYFNRHNPTANCTRFVCSTQVTQQLYPPSHTKNVVYDKFAEHCISVATAFREVSQWNLDPGKYPLIRWLVVQSCLGRLMSSKMKLEFQSEIFVLLHFAACKSKRVLKCLCYRWHNH